jgi:hypothetical protein
MGRAGSSTQLRKRLLDTLSRGRGVEQPRPYFLPVFIELPISVILRSWISTLRSPRKLL